MSVSKKKSRPTASELKILAILWERGPSTVREVHSKFERGTGYTTVLKLMQIMMDKRLLVREEQGRAHVYRPAIAPERTQKTLVGELIDKAFGGSVRKLLMAALSSKRASTEDLNEIGKIIDQMKREGD